MSTPGADDERRRADGFPPEPRPPGSGPKPVRAPMIVNVSCGLWAVTAILIIFGFVVTLLSKDQIVTQLVQQVDGGRKARETISEGTTSLLWMLFVAAVAFAGLIGLFAYKAREGTRSARSVLTVLTGIMIVTQFVLFPNIVTIMACLVALAALVLMYLPSVAGHYPRIPKTLHEANPPDE